MMKFAVPCDEDDYGDTDVWHSLTAASQQFRQCSTGTSKGRVVSSGEPRGRVVFSSDIVISAKSSFVRG
ncbi:hypothetical protein NPIL_604921 [Nephila pilipes]|uniref:Uncharacterized protein n=1 Tax=Nephila pilipes TaxID=299642 RepID=A0A8X6QUH5_NEPPI|nr:hypothetical protein NPIL_604921 [Nephila pilipes]